MELRPTVAAGMVNSLDLLCLRRPTCANTLKFTVYEEASFLKEVQMYMYL